MATVSSSYAQRLAQAIEAKGVTKASLARHLGVSQQALNHVFTGHTRSFTAENNVRAAEFLGVDCEWLATGTAPEGTTARVTLTLSQSEARLLDAFRNQSREK